MHLITQRSLSNVISTVFVDINDAEMKVKEVDDNVKGKEKVDIDDVVAGKESVDVDDNVKGKEKVNIDDIVAEKESVDVDDSTEDIESDIEVAPIPIVPESTSTAATKEEEKKVYCTSKCTRGCKNCICARKGEKCNDKCSCNDCANRTTGATPLSEESIIFNITDWKIDGMCETKILEKDRKTGSVKDIPEEVIKNFTPLAIFELLMEGLTNHIIEESNKLIPTLINLIKKLS